MHCAIYCSNPGSPEKESRSVLLLAYCSPTSMLSKGVHGCLDLVYSFSFSFGRIETAVPAQALVSILV